MADRIQIPVYDQRVAPQLQTSGADTPLTTVQDNAGAALQQVGTGLDQVAGALQFQQQQDAQALVSKRINDDQVKWLQQLQDAKNQAQPGAPDFTPTILQNFDDYAKTSLDSLPDGPQKRLYGMRLNDLRTTVASNAITWQAQQHRAYNVDLYSQGNDAAARGIAMDPSQYAQSRATQLALINTSSLDAETKTKLVDQFKDQASTAAGMRMIDSDPQSAYAAMTQDPSKPLPSGFSWISDVPPEKLTVMQGHARTLIQQQQNAADRDQLARSNQASTALNTAIDQWTNGRLISPDYAQQLTQLAAGTDQAQRVQEFVGDAMKTGGFASKSLVDQQAEIDQLNTHASTPGQGLDDIDSKYLTQIQGLHQKALDAYKTNPLEAAADRGVIQGPQSMRLQTMPVTDLDSALQVIHSRAGVLPSVEAAAQTVPGAPTSVSPFQPQEATQLLHTLDAMSPEAKGSALQQLGAAIGDPGRIHALAGQWRDQDKNEHLSLSMLYGSMGTSGAPLTNPNGTPISTFILDGQRALDSGTVKVDPTADAGLRSTITRQIAGTLPPQQADDATKAAYLMAIGNAARNNSTTVSSDNISKAVQAATGGLVDTGGTPLSSGFSHYQTALPYYWSADDFNSAVKNASPQSIENRIGNAVPDHVLVSGTSVPASDFMSKLASYRLQRVGIDGTYWVMAGPNFVKAPDGTNLSVKLSRAAPTPTAARTAAQPETLPDVPTIP